MTVIEQIKFDSQRNKGKNRKVVAKRILELIECWKDGRTGHDYFIFAHTFQINVKVYKIFAELNDEQIDKLDEYVEMLNNPRQ